MSGNPEIRAKIVAIVTELFGVSADTIRDDARPDRDLKLDSLDMVEFVMELEDRFHIAISDDEGAQLASVTFGGVVAFVEERVK